MAQERPGSRLRRGQVRQSGEPARQLDRHLETMIEAGASDLYLRAGRPPVLRVNGRMQSSGRDTPTDVEMKSYVEHVLSPLARRRFEQSPDVDVAYTLEGRARFRLNLFMHTGRIGIVARLIPLGAVRFEQLHVPDAVADMAENRTGLVLVVGPTGCGKSTTLAAMVHHINSTREGHIVTVEDPIEFIHEEDRCLIHQRQVGQDTESFPTALRHVVRQSPDVILIGEMRDTETMRTALSAALTGHLVLTTLHTTNAVQSIERILNYFPPEARAQAELDLATTLIGVVSMRLLPRANGHGRIPACEVLLNTPLVRRMISEGRLVEIYDVMKRNEDMLTLNQALVQLCQEGHVRREVALPYAPNRDEFRLNMEGMFTGIDSIDLRTEKKPDEEESQ